MNLYRSVTIYLLLILIALSGFSQGHHIEITLRNSPDSTIFLAYHYGDKQFVKDTIAVNRNGQVIISGEERLDGGVYLIVLSGMQYFELLVGEDQDFSVDVDVNDFLGSMKFKGSPENEAFLSYQKYLQRYNKKNTELFRLQSKLKNKPDSLQLVTGQIEQNNESLNSYLDTIHASFPGSFLSDLIRAMTPPQVPDFDLSLASNPDSVKMARTYLFLRDHYFDKVNFGNENLIRTPILHNKLYNYFNRVLIQRPDSIIPQVDRVIHMAEQNDRMFQYVIVFALNNFIESKIMGLDAVFVDVAEKYYLSGRAEWANSGYLEKLKERVQKIKPNLIGVRAADLKMETVSGEWVSLHEVEADFTVLYFWEPNCGFCKESTPRLYSLYEKYKDRGLAVFAVDTQDNRQDWENYLNEHGYDWINAWDPDRQTYFRFFFDVYSTPTLYLLDKDKTIIAKRVDVEALENMLDRLINQKATIY